MYSLGFRGLGIRVEGPCDIVTIGLFIRQLDVRLLPILVKVFISYPRFSPIIDPPSS